MRKMLKFISIALAIAIIICILVCSYIVFDGYKLYKKAVDATPVDQMISNVKSSEKYTASKDISPYFLNAVVAVEDRRFYTHNGFDIISTARAVVTNIISGELMEGGSTITQQLSKNLYFSMDKNFSRKVAEVFMSAQIESSCTSKDEILEMYVNVIYFGNNCYGVKDAAAFYFGKSPKDLTLDEASLLAGLPKAPSSYGVNREKQLKRQEDVLEAMVVYGTITKEEADSIISGRK